MEEDSHHNQPDASSSSSAPTATTATTATTIADSVDDRASSLEPLPSVPPSSSPQEQEQEEGEEGEVEDEENRQEEQDQEEHQLPQQRERQEENQSFIRNGVNVQPPVSDAFSYESRDDVWACTVVLLTFWFFTSMTLILGFYGPQNLRLGPNCSRLFEANSFFIDAIKVQEFGAGDHGVMLYGFDSPPPLDGATTWSETQNATLPSDSHEEWLYFLNEGSEINISYSVVSQSFSRLFLVIAEGKDNLIDWIENPAYPNVTPFWDIVHGSGTIHRNIFKSSDYYIAVGNLNPEEMKVQLNISIRASLYNTTDAYFKCSLARGPCISKLSFMGSSVAVLTSSAPEQGSPSEDWYVKLSYNPRWISYFVGSGVMTVLIVLLVKMCTKFESTGGQRSGRRAVEVGTERSPLLMPKDDDLSSWGSSYGSVSHDEEDIEESLIANALETRALKDGETINPRRLCVICFNAPRDCFFLPCGHWATCFNCGTRIAEGTSTCPLCRRKFKKVKMIYPA